MTKYYPTNPTDWTTALEKIYAKQSEQLRRHHDQLRQRDQQMVTKAQNENITKVFESLAGFSSTVSKAVQAGEVRKEKRDSAERLQADLDYSLLHQDTKEILKKTLEQNEGIKDLKVDYALWKKTIESSNINAQDKKILLKKHGGYLARIHERMGFNVLEGIQTSINEHAKNNPKFQVEWDAEKSAGREEAFLKKYSVSKLNELGFSKDFILTSFYKPLDKWLNTKGVMAKIRDNKIHHTEQEVDADVRLDNARDSGNLTLELHTQLVELGYDKPAMINRLKRLIKSGRLTDSERDSMLEGDLPLALKFSGGTKGKDLFSKEQLEELETASKEYNTQFLALKEVERNAALNSSSVEYLQTGDENKKQAALAAYLSAGGKDTDEAFVELDNSNFDLQTPEAYDAAVIETNEITSSGTSSSYDVAINSTQNTQRKRELEKEKEDYKLNRKLNGLDENNANQLATNAIDTRNELNLAPGGKVPAGSPTIAKNILSTNYDRIYKEVYDEIGDPTSKRVKIEADNRFEKFITDLGFKDDKINGILTPDIHGRFPALEAWVGGKREFESGDLPTTSTAELTRSWNNLQGVKSVEKLLQTKGAALSNAEIVAFTNNSWDQAKGTVNYWPPDVLLKSEILGVQPSTLVKMQLEALINSKDPNDVAIVQNLELEGLVDKIPTADVELRKFLEKNNAIDLLSKYEYQGIRGLQPKDLIEIANLESIVSESGEKLTKNIRDNKIKAGKQLDKKRNAQQALDTFNKQFPKSNFTRKDIKWDDELKTWVLITK